MKEKEKNWGSLGKLLFQDLRGSWLGLEGDLTLALLPLFVKNVSFVNPEKLFFFLIFFLLCTQLEVETVKICIKDILYALLPLLVNSCWKTLGHTQ